MDNNKAMTPTLFHPLTSAFLLNYLGAYFFLGRFNPLLGRYCLLGKIFHMGMISVPIGTLVTSLNHSVVIHILDGSRGTKHLKARYAMSDPVYALNPKLAKLESNHLGPFKVAGVYYSHTYQLEDAQVNTKTLHHGCLHPCFAIITQRLFV
ncbi:hypothetical protein DSO57_1028427 [Entomophthora muscae]|uniref:Uncharacterized protein n=1 Tax=Entomophthora muscae TaxID=34485 RepID=A0ACC2RSH1_9FUNG|nr:hypothetical protein DSO57_1028427 [Entomophthora muscae]